MNQPPPVLGRSRNRSREREGADTEVEADAMRLGIHRSQTRVQPEMFPVIDLTEDDDLHDTEMVDGALDFGRRTIHVASGSFDPNVDADAVGAARSTSLSPDFTGHDVMSRHNRVGTSGAAGTGADTSEGEGSGGGSADEVAMEAELHESEINGGVEGDLTVGGKRKR